MQKQQANNIALDIGVVGIGLMGSSIIALLLCYGHKVKAIAPIAADLENARSKISTLLKICFDNNILNEEIDTCLKRLEISDDYNGLRNCSWVMECVVENMEIKRQVYKKITDAVSPDTIIGTNTSAIAITDLQNLIAHPQRFLGIHWAEPAYATRFMEITNGHYTNPQYTQWVFDFARKLGKEPTVLKKDIKGFITNRLMYAVYRELFHLVESGKITKEDADKAFRYDVGSWITLMGVFKRMDYTGTKDYAAIFENTFPKLSNTENVPDVMQQIVDCNGQGIKNQIGLYAYTKQEAMAWKKALAAFNTEIFNLATQYPSLEEDKVLA